MKHLNGDRHRGPRGVTILSTLGGIVLACSALLSVPSGIQAQQAGGSPKKAATAQDLGMTPADSAACSQVVAYAFQHPEILQKGEQLQAGNKAKEIRALPDTVRAGIAAAIAKGQADTLKAMARRILDAETAKTYDEFIGFVVTFPDSVRAAVATLVASGKSLTCS